MNGYKNVGRHPEILDGGRPVGVGEITELSEKELESEHNQDLIERGILIDAELQYDMDALGIEASPAARSLAAEFGIDLSTINGTGTSGGITKTDVQAAIDERGDDQ